MTAPIITVGHSNHDPEFFVRLLKDADITLVVDVRSQPYSAYSPQFNGQTLKSILTDHGIRYRHEPDLGGRPDDPDMYDSTQHVLYGRVAESPAFVEAIERLEKLSCSLRTVIMCSEEDPTECHRRLLVGRMLEKQGRKVLHLRADGKMQTEEELPKTLTAREGLFEGGEFSTWRSIRSVSPGRRPPSSSES